MIRGDRNAPSARAAARILSSMGWRYDGEIPTPRRAVCLGVPHTTNMDGVLLLLLARSVGMPIHWMVKDAWVRGPLAPVVKGLGAVPIDRSKANGMVQQMVDAFRTHDDFYLVIPPEGTRSYTDYWKSGFYRIALGAAVPIIPGFLDYANKRGGFYEPIVPTGNVRTDMDKLREVYRDARAMARYPEKFGPIRLREEET